MRLESPNAKRFAYESLSPSIVRPVPSPYWSGNEKMRRAEARTVTTLKRTTTNNSIFQDKFSGLLEQELKERAVDSFKPPDSVFCEILCTMALPSPLLVSFSLSLPLSLSLSLIIPSKV
jgi:hypothetical protein